MEALVHSEFVGLSSSGGVYDRQFMVDTVSQETSSDRVVIADFETHTISEDTVLVTYRSIGGTGDETRRSSLWVRTEEWQLRFHQGTPTPNNWGHIS